MNESIYHATASHSPSTSRMTTVYSICIISSSFYKIISIPYGMQIPIYHSSQSSFAHHRHYIHVLISINCSSSTQNKAFHLVFLSFCPYFPTPPDTYRGHTFSILYLHGQVVFNNSVIIGPRYSIANTCKESRSWSFHRGHVRDPLPLWKK